ncbi:MAG: efflux RND transporter permease subunit [Verrucomicrobiota bacterium]
MDSFSTLFFRNRHLLVLSIVVILVGGLSAFENLPRQEDPRIVNRSPLVLTFMPGASTERVETLITEVLEESLDEIAEIKNLESTSRAGASLISIELMDWVEDDQKDEIFSRIRDKLAEAAASLPREASEPFMDDKRNAIAFTNILALKWVGEGAPNLGILNRLAEDLADQMRNVNGTELVRIYGAPREEITVEAQWKELAEIGLTAGDIAQSIALADTKAPSGTLRANAANVQVEIEGELDSINRIADIPIRTNETSALLRVGDIAEVKRGWQIPVTDMGFVDGQRSVFLAVRMEAGQRIDQWSVQANRVIDQFSENTGASVELESVFAQVDYTMDRLNTLVSNLVAGALIVVTVVFVMMGWRLALIIGAALPLVVALVLFVFQISGIPIHQMSVFGMIIALGLLIDNAIVMADEVATRKAKGLSGLVAVRESVHHLFLPLLSSTITTVLAFAPIFLLPGGAGDFVGTISTGVILALMASFVVAMTITSALSGIFVKPPHAQGKKRFLADGWGHKVEGLLSGVLRLSLMKPVLAILCVGGAAVSGFVLSTTLGNSFFPAVDRNMFELHLWLPESASIGKTKDQALEVEQAINSFDESKRVYWLVGGSFPSVYYNLIMNKDNSPFYAHGIVTTGSAQETDLLIPKLQQALDDQFPGAQIVIREFGQGPPVVADIEYRIYGPTLEGIQDIGEKVRYYLQKHPDVLATQTTLPRAEPKIFIKASEEETSLAGLSLANLAEQLQGNLEGAVGGSVIEDLEEMPIRVRLAQDQRKRSDRVASTNFIVHGSESWVPLSALGELELRPEIGGITRFNGERTNIIKAYTVNDALPIDITQAVLQELKETEGLIPPGYRVDVGGAAEQDAEAKGNLVLYIPILLTLTIATLILTFRSFVLAILLLVSAGLSVGFGLIATWVMQFPISFNTILGSLGLIGLAFNNSIVVIAAIRMNLDSRLGHMDAVHRAVVGATRHIVSTTLTTIGGFLPLLLLVGGEFWPSLAIVLGGGVGGSMFLALVFTPASYVLLARLKIIREPERKIEKGDSMNYDMELQTS